MPSQRQPLYQWVVGKHGRLVSQMPSLQGGPRTSTSKRSSGDTGHGSAGKRLSKPLAFQRYFCLQLVRFLRHPLAIQRGQVKLRKRVWFRKKWIDPAYQAVTRGYSFLCSPYVRHPPLSQVGPTKVQDPGKNDPAAADPATATDPATTDTAAKDAASKDKDGAPPASGRRRSSMSRRSGAAC